MVRASMIGAVVALGALSTFTAQAQPPGRGGRGHEAPPPVVQEPTAPNPLIVTLMNGLSWGMTRDELVARVRQQIRDKYWPDIQAVADDAIAEQNFRNRMEREQQAFENSCVKFDGEATPWDVSMVDGEFTHRNQEEMCKLDLGDHTDHFFFIRGKLWKIFRALSSGVLAAAPPPFEEMRTQMETEFGPGEEINVVNAYTLVRELVGLRWIDSETELKLMWLDLYGVFSIVLTNRPTLGNLANLRTVSTGTSSSTDTGTGRLIDAVTTGSSTDENSDIVERLSGQRPDPTAPPEGGESTPRNRPPLVP